MSTEFALRNTQDITRIMGFLHGTSLDKPKVVTIKDEKRPDVLNRKMWAMLRDISNQVEWYGKKLTDEDWKCLFSASVEKQRAEPGLDGGFVVMAVSTRKQSAKWFSDFFEVMQAFGAERNVRFSETDKWGGRYDN
ncbi:MULTISPECIES: recombination protein NinB [unclassified Pseudomonas]|uniref:recombination protein NinB n=1 Tax=unclassified Pseudomonas TaxID=196821 RepID=UPI002B22E180|nr:MULTISPECIES: recombination protein NinB [unclassified Pseudomonas]MEA9994559.1 recombination protein NinB [Pseudomonas sp. AA4]MEB0085704.1 recombination protein NinB [Pseudomonas sp. RTI1]MEB0125971.1 recombination protein NinB [Pseudomonas sp. CCC1.2]MEB0152775.1 recombination protein NinB [Pseudomonas sp. CCC4.3]MEB0221280.1 recombination protein NinB [Pseudomonas sp. AB12(2023)]